jgi:hypothetical protein
MEPVFRELKEKVLRFPRDLVLKMRTKGKNPVQLRTRIVSFTDVVLTPETRFINFGKETLNWTHHNFVQRLKIDTACMDNRRASLEALAIAMASDWTQDGDRQRHIIVMFTDASAHRLEDRVGEVPAKLLPNIPLTLDELEEKWDLQSHHGLSLALFTPDVYPWSTIGDCWARTLFLPSKAGEGLAEFEYKTILEIYANEL